MKLDLSKMKKVHSSRTHTIMEHPDGHTVHISHSALKPQDLKHIESIKMAEGGPVSTASNQQADLKEQVKKKMSSPKPYLPGSDEERKKVQDSFTQALAEGGDVKKDEEPKLSGFAAEMKDQAPSSPAPVPQSPLFPDQSGVIQPLPPAQGQMQPVASDPLLNTVKENEKRVTGAIEGAEKAVQQQADIAGDVGTAQAVVESGQQKQIKSLQSKYETERQSLHSEIDSLAKDMKDHPVIPRKMFQGMGTWDRISTGLGALVAGLGGNRPENNPVLKMLNQDIDRDLEAQKLNMDQKNNLMGVAFKKLGDLNQASQFAKANIIEAGIHQLNQIAARSQDPMQKAKAMQTASMLKLEQSNLLNSVAQSRALYEGSSGSSPEDQGNAALRIGLLPEKQQPEATKELQQAENINNAKTNLMGAFDKVDQMVLGGLFSPNEKAALIDPLVAQLSKESAGRFTEADARAIHNLFPSATDAPNTRLVKRQQLEKFIGQDKVSYPTLARFRIPIPGRSNTQIVSQKDDFGFKPSKK